jgi:hypothetical protein
LVSSRDVDEALALAADRGSEQIKGASDVDQRRCRAIGALVACLTRLHLQYLPRMTVSFLGRFRVGHPSASPPAAIRRAR